MAESYEKEGEGWEEGRCHILGGVRVITILVHASHTNNYPINFGMETAMKVELGSFKKFVLQQPKISNMEVNKSFSNYTPPPPQKKLRFFFFKWSTEFVTEMTKKKNIHIYTPHIAGTSMCQKRLEQGRLESQLLMRNTQSTF